MKKFIKTIIFVVLFTNLALPFLVWWPSAQNSFGQQFSASIFMSLFFPLMGLWALNLLWVQFMVGAWRTALGKVFEPALVMKWHIWEGVVAYVFALLHPFILLASLQLMGLSYFSVLANLPDPLKLYWASAIVAFLFLTLAVLAGLLRKNKFMVRYWKKMHYLTYLALPLIFYHSWKIGSHTQATNYKYWWYMMVLTFAVTSVFRLVYHVREYRAFRQARATINQQ